MELGSKKIKIFLGTGGVGKTTLAAMYALKLARKNPKKKIKLITIDPSRRLKDYFDIHEGQKECLFENLTISLKTRQALLKEFITDSYKGESSKVEKTYSNKIFNKLIGGLSVSQEFTSLYEIYKSQHENYDYLIIDTPPLQNAGSFLKSADELEGLFSSSLIQFFVPPSDKGILKRLFHKAQQKSFAVLSKLTGAEFVKELMNFFDVIDAVRPEILKVTSVARAMLSSDTEVYTVCNHNELSLAGLKLSLKSLEDQQIYVAKNYINKYVEASGFSSNIDKKIESLFSLNGEQAFKMIKHFNKEPLNTHDLIEIGEQIEF